MAFSAAMVLKLDPRIPLVWRNPFTLQFGISNPVAVFIEVSSAAEHMIQALSSGISASGLAMVGKAAGATPAEIDAFLQRIAPVLLRETVPERVRTVLVAGTGATANQLAVDLSSSGFRVLIAHDAATAASQPCDFAIIVAAFVVPPDLHGLWLRRDTPHLAVVLGDSTVTVGPMVEPGTGPCLHCMRRYATESDAAWPAIATQLLGRRAAAESPLVASEAAALATRLVTRRFVEGAASVHEAHTLSVDTGEVSTREWLPHPQCGCIQPGGLSEPVQPEIDSPVVGRRVVRSRQPTTGQAASARA